MSKIFTHRQTPDGARVVVERASDGSNVYRPATARDRDLVRIDAVDSEEIAKGMLAWIALIAMAGGVGLVLYFWWHWILLGGIVFLLLVRWAANQSGWR